MPFVLFAAGLLLVVSAVRGTNSQLYALLKNDFTGSGSFIPWLVSLLSIGALGYFAPIKPIVNAFLLLVIIVLFLSNGGFFNKFIQQTGIGTHTGITGNLNSLGNIPTFNSTSIGQ